MSRNFSITPGNWAASLVESGHADSKAVNLDVSRGDLLVAAMALLKCCSGRIGMAQTACSRGLAESSMRVNDLHNAW
jgi:hypothetical protein